MAQGKQIQEANGVKDALVFDVLRDLRLEWRQIRQYVAVSEDDSTRLGSCARGKDDLSDVIATDPRGLIGCGRMSH